MKLKKYKLLKICKLNGMNMNLLSIDKINYIINTLEIKKNTTDNYINSYIASVMMNDLSNIKYINEFRRKYAFTVDIFENFYLLNIQTKDHELYLINDDNGYYDMGTIDYNKVKFIDFPLVYRNKEVHAIWNKDKLPNNIDNIEINLVDDDIYYLHKFKSIKCITNPEIGIRGKDWVKHYIFNDTNLIGTLYFIKLDINNKIVYKVGITKHNIEKRFKGLNKNIKLLNIIEIKRPILECVIIEKYIHDTNKELREYNIEYDFEGKTECYFNDMYYLYDDDIYERALQHLDDVKYPINSKMIKLIKYKGMI